MWCLVCILRHSTHATLCVCGFVQASAPPPKNQFRRAIHLAVYNKTIDNVMVFIILSNTFVMFLVSASNLQPIPHGLYSSVSLKLREQANNWLAPTSSSS